MVDRLELAHHVQKNETKVRINDTGIKDTLTLEEQAKLVSLVEWQRNHDLPVSWWYIRMNFDEDRREVIDQFESLLVETIVPNATPGKVVPMKKHLTPQWDNLTRAEWEKLVKNNALLITRYQTQATVLIERVTELNTTKDNLANELKVKTSLTFIVVLVVPVMLPCIFFWFALMQS
jgi:hypothetical protein